MKKGRQFSVPYNGSNPEEYIKRIGPYMDHVDHVFLSLPNHRSHLTDIIESNRKDYNKGCHDFLNNTKKSGLKRVVTLNTNYDLLFQDELDRTADEITQKLFYYDVDGVIITSFGLGKRIRENLPNIKISTSCNCFQYDTREMKMWDKEIGIDFFNPPRSSARNIPLLQKMHNEGFKLKVLVNEGCLVGCPQEISHYVSMGNNIGQWHDCLRGDLANVFRGCWVLPRWLDKLDGIVDAYKISGRFAKTDKIFNLLDAYLNGTECDFSDIYDNYQNCSGIPKVPIYTDDIPDKLATCLCAECDTCKLCDKLAKKLFV